MTSLSDYANSFGVNPNSKLGSEYQVQWNRYKTYNQKYGEGLSLKDTMILNGIDSDVVLQRIENHIEGNDNVGDGKNANLLSWDSYLASNDNQNDVLFTNVENDKYTNVDFNNDDYSIMNQQGFTEELGMDWTNGKPYDAFKVNQNKISFYDFVFGGTSDGDQQNVVFNLSEMDNARWGLQNYVIREVDTSYWGKALDSSNAQNTLSHDSLEIIKQSLPQWVTAEIKEQLSAYKENSAEYWNKFYEIAVKMMDQEGLYNGSYKA